DRPAPESSATGSTLASSSGTQSRSLSASVPRSRTTTAPDGPVSGTPATASASAAVVPAATATLAGTADGYGCDDTVPPGARWCSSWYVDAIEGREPNPQRAGRPPGQEWRASLQAPVGRSTCAGRTSRTGNRGWQLSAGRSCSGRASFSSSRSAGTARHG